jgi:hypothetical protein
MNNRLERLIKALTVSGEGDKLRQPEIDRIIAQIREYKNPLFSNLPRRRGSGDAWYVNRRTPGSTSAQFVGDTDAITEDTGAYTQVTFAYKTIGAKGKVSRRLQAQGRSYTDVLATEIEAKTLDFKDYEDWAYIWGSVSADADQFDGLNTLVSGSQVVAITTATGGDDLTLEKMDELIDTCAFDPDLLVCSKTGRRKLNGLIQANQRYPNVVEIRGGAKVIAYNDIPLLVSTNITDTMTFSGTDVTASTGGSTSAILALDTTYLWVAELTPITIEALGKASSQYDEFEIYCDEVVVLSNTLACAKLAGLKVS